MILILFHFTAWALGTLLFLAALPLVLELLVLSTAAAFPVHRRASAGPGAADFSLAVIIPAHNEEKLIAACVTSLRASSGANVRIFVVAHNCSDATATHAAAAGAEVLPLNDSIGGKGTALDFGFRHALAAGASAVLVIDADSLVASNLTSAVCARLAAGAAALQCRYVVANAEANLRTRLASLAFLGMNVLRPRGRAWLGLSCGIFGNGFALSAETLNRVPYGANSLVEDLEYHLLLLRAGMRVEFVDEASVFGEMPDNNAASSTQRARWEGGRMLMRKQWTGRLLGQVAQGRLRMLEPLLDLLALPLVMGAASLMGALVLSLLAGSLSLALAAAVGLLTLILYVLIAASLSTEPAKTLKALAGGPGYLVWKLRMIPRARRAAAKNAAWIRTKRNQDAD